MRAGILIAMALVVAACPRKHVELQKAVFALEARAAEKRVVIATLNDRARETMVAEVKLKEALQGRPPPEADAGEVELFPPQAPVVVPEKSFFETEDDTRARLKIAMLEAENTALDKMLEDVSGLEARRERAEAQLKLLEAMRPDGGAR